MSDMNVEMKEKKHLEESGVLIVNKERDFTSFDVVAKLRGILGTRKLGHGGTLDPEATGVLPVFVNKATKLCDVILSEEKCYKAEMTLGIATDTEDIWGNVLEEREVHVSKEDIEKAILSFVGTYDQVPPMYSAKKVNGKKLYEYARRGIEIEREAVPVTISKIEILSITEKSAEFRVSCSKGTYIRTLIKDIGEKLGCLACMSALHREQHGIFKIEKAYTLAEIEKLMQEDCISDILLPIDSLYEGAPKVYLTEEGLKGLSNGNKLKKSQVKKMVISGEEKLSSDILYDAFQEDTVFLLYDANDAFKALYQYDFKDEVFVSYKMF